MKALTRPRHIALYSVPVLTILFPVAHAHPGHATNNVFLSGLAHPVTGVDHLLAMLAIGLWSALSFDSARKAFSTPISFSLVLLLGALLGITGLNMPYIEPTILASLLTLGLLLACRTKLPITIGAILAGIFALAHGLAHGMELPAEGSAILFIIGFMLSTLLIHGAGLLLGFYLNTRSQWPGRLAGTGIAAYGVTLMII